MDFMEALGPVRVIPVVEIPSAEHAVPLAETLVAGGLPCAEVTFRTASALDAIGAIATAVPTLRLGAGTVLTVEQAEAAVEAGARFLVSPGLEPAVLHWARDNDVPFLPGVCSPSEIMRARALGARTLKLFPAEAMGGVDYLRAVAAPFTDVRFVPTGGIGAANLREYLALRQVAACGGSWMVKKELIAAAAYDTIERLTIEAVALAQAAPTDHV